MGRSYSLRRKGDKRVWDSMPRFSIPGIRKDDVMIIPSFPLKVLIVGSACGRRGIFEGCSFQGLSLHFRFMSGTIPLPLPSPQRFVVIVDGCRQLPCCISVSLIQYQPSHRQQTCLNNYCALQCRPRRRRKAGVSGAMGTLPFLHGIPGQGVLLKLPTDCGCANEISDAMALHVLSSCEV